MQRKAYVDVVKGLGILAVMITHCCGIPVIGKYIIASYMAWFFVCSGYVYRENEKSLKSLVLDKGKKLLIPYFKWSIIVFVLYLRVGFHFNIITFEWFKNAFYGMIYSRFSVYKNGDYRLMVFSNAPLWFLTVMFVSSVIFLILIKKCDSLFHTGMALLVCSVVTFALNDIELLLPWSIDTAFAGAFFMIIGKKMRESEIVEGGRSEKTILPLLLIVVYIGLVNYNAGINMSIRAYGNHGGMSVLLFFAIGVIGSYIIMIFAKRIEHTKVGKLMIKLGQNTIPLLAVHLVLMQWIGFMFPKLQGLSADAGEVYWIYNFGKVALVIVIVFGGIELSNKIKRKYTSKKLVA